MKLTLHVVTAMKLDSHAQFPRRIEQWSSALAAGAVWLYNFERSLANSRRHDRCQISEQDSC